MRFLDSWLRARKQPWLKSAAGVSLSGVRLRAGDGDGESKMGLLTWPWGGKGVSCLQPGAVSSRPPAGSQGDRQRRD